MQDFQYIGEPSGLVLSRLGLPQDTLIKIRRKISSGVLRQMSSYMAENVSVTLPPGLMRMSSQEIMDSNQRTLKAESLYSYRLRAESLWGKTEDGDPNSRPDSVRRGPPRKRWVSDADAGGIAAEKVSRALIEWGGVKMANFQARSTERTPALYVIASPV